MKHFVCLAFVFIGVTSGFAQTVIGITTDKTTSLVFPFAIRHVDRGTQAVLAQHLKETPTILLVKASEKNFAETNLSVVTDDGSVYAFMVSYNPQPAVWVHYLPIIKRPTLAAQALAILDNPPMLKRPKAESLDVSLKLIGIYIKDNVIFYQLQAENDGPIDYDVDMLRFSVKDQRKNKRTTIQEIEHSPLHTAGNASQIEAFSKNVVVVALEKFTIPDKKLLFIQTNEKSGGRHLSLRITNRTLLKGAVLPDVQ